MKANQQITSACEILIEKIDLFLVEIQFGQVEVKSTLLNEFGIEA